MNITKRLKAQKCYRPFKRGLAFENKTDPFSEGLLLELRLLSQFSWRDHCQVFVSKTFRLHAFRPLAASDMKGHICHEVGGRSKSTQEKYFRGKNLQRKSALLHISCLYYEVIYSEDDHLTQENSYHPPSGRTLVWSWCEVTVWVNKRPLSVCLAVFVCRVCTLWETFSQVKIAPEADCLLRFWGSRLSRPYTTSARQQSATVIQVKPGDISSVGRIFRKNHRKRSTNVQMTWPSSLKRTGQMMVKGLDWSGFNTWLSSC